MRAFRLAELLLNDEVVLQARFDLQSGPMGWVATTTELEPGSSVRDLDIERIYKLRLLNGDTSRVRLQAVHQATGQARFRGVDEMPAPLALPPDLPLADAPLDDE